MPRNRAHLLILKLSAKTHWRNYSWPRALKLFPPASPPPPIPTTAVKSSLLFCWSWRAVQRGLPAQGCSSRGSGNIWSIVSAPVLLLQWQTKKTTAIKGEQPEHLLKRRMNSKSWLVPTSELRTVPFPTGSLCLMSSCNSGSWASGAPSLPLLSTFPSLIRFRALPVEKWFVHKQPTQRCLEGICPCQELLMAPQ